MTILLLSCHIRAPGEDVDFGGERARVLKAQYTGLTNWNSKVPFPSKGLYRGLSGCHTGAAEKGLGECM